MNCGQNNGQINFAARDKNPSKYIKFPLGKPAKIMAKTMEFGTKNE
jgi:hypothetical protein